MFSAQPITKTLDVLLTRLHEAHEVSAYAAIERLMLGGEAVGLDADNLVRMLERGITLETLFEVIESEMQRSQRQGESLHDRVRAA